MNGANPTAFDDLAADYDAQFTHSPIGRVMRDAVWRRLDSVFGAGDHVLELGCGTGEDAIHLAGRGVAVTATDSSTEMLRIARTKIAGRGVDHLVVVERLDLERIESWASAHDTREDPRHAPRSGYDGAVANFGGLNCVSDLGSVGRALRRVLRPGARVFLCVMGPYVPWEWAWFLARGQPSHAFRRLTRRGTTWRGMRVFYPSIRQLRRALGTRFRASSVRAIGVLVPPTFANGWAERHPGAIDRLNRWERRLESVFPLPWLADHYLIELELHA